MSLVCNVKRTKPCLPGIYRRVGEQELWNISHARPEDKRLRKDLWWLHTQRDLLREWEHWIRLPFSLPP